MPAEKQLFLLLGDTDDKILTEATLANLSYNMSIRFFRCFNELMTGLVEHKPSVILIDYNLKPESGLQLLKKLKSATLYRSVPVVILMDSPRWQDYEECYMNGASTVIKKPDTDYMTSHKIKTFFDYWLNVAETKSAAFPA